VKWEPVALMVLLILLGAWLVRGPGREGDPVRIGALRGHLLVDKSDPDAWAYTIDFRHEGTVGPLSEAELRGILGDRAVDTIRGSQGNALFKLLNITSWAGILWVAIGFGGQIAFFGRMAIQWVVSEKRGQSVVPEVFWWLSLFGGIALFSYFVWRQDLVGVLGQSTGVVIYARNIRLIYKKRGRDARHAARVANREARAVVEAEATPGGVDLESPYVDPAPEPLDRPS
jgi:lipid-A-disaccharide synthase-like uncharacterized protein